MFQIRRCIYSFIFCALMLLPLAAHADTAINAAGAADLKKQVEESLQWRIDMAKALGQGLSLSGPIEVTPKDSFYEVRLPGAAIVMGPQGRLDLGTVVMQAKPGVTGEWLTEVTIQSPLKFYNAANTPISEITIGKQHFSGTWWPMREMYSKCDALYQDIAIRTLGSSNFTQASVSSLKSVIDLSDNGDGTWKGPAEVEVLGIKAMTAGPTPGEASVAKISSHSIYTRLDTRQVLYIKKVFQDAMKAGLPADEKEKRDMLKKMMSKYTSSSITSVNEVTSNVEISDFLFHETLPPGSKDQPREIKFAKAAFAGSSSGTQGDKAKLFMKTSFNGLHVSFVPALYAGLVPETFNTEITLDNVPLKKILETVFASLGQPETSADGKPVPPKPVDPAALRQILQDAGTFMKIDNTFTKSADIETMLSGKIDANAQAPLGATGKIALAVKGIDETIKKFSNAVGQPGGEKAMGAAAALTVLQRMGQADKPADGKSLHNYIFEMTADGKLLLNNIDFRMLTAGLSAAGAMGNAPEKPMETPMPQAAPVAPAVLAAPTPPAPIAKP